MSRKKIKINIKPKDNSPKPVNKQPESKPNPPSQKKETLTDEQRRAKERDQQILEQRARLKQQQQAENQAPQAQDEPKTETEPPKETTTKSSRRSTRNSRRKSQKSSKAAKAKARQAQVSGVKKNLVRGLLLLLVVLGGYYFFKWTSGPSTPDPIVKTEDPDQPNFIPEIDESEKKFYKYGLDTRNYDLDTQVPLDDKPLNEVLNELRIERSSIGELQVKARQILRPSLFKARHKYTVFKDKETHEPAYLVYEASPLQYLTFGLADSTFVEKVVRETVTTRKSLGLTLATTLDEAFYKKSIDNKLAHDLDDALASTIDLFRIKPGSEFKIYYDETFADGDRVDSKLIAAFLKSDNRDYYAFWYENGGTTGYFDERARPTKRSFLKSPLEFGRVTSKYGSRTHPVTGIVKTHKGTDFAAPSGTPIRALADGVVSIAQFKKNNGNYVKIKHSDTYDTQYLHMLSFAEGIEPGATVRQGQTIGLVGSTGMSTGPHVCLRFWENNKQIDFLNTDLPANQPISAGLARTFASHKDSLKQKLDELQAL